jgi:hypothetical protein
MLKKWIKSIIEEQRKEIYDEACKLAALECRLHRNSINEQWKKELDRINGELKKMRDDDTAFREERRAKEDRNRADWEKHVERVEKHGEQIERFLVAIEKKL